MKLHVCGAVLGACLLAIPPVVAPNVEHRAVALTSAGFVIDLTSPIDAVVASLDGESAVPLASVSDALTPDGGPVDGMLGGELPDVGGLLSMVAGPASADPLGDFLTTIFYGGLFLFGGIVVSVGQFFQTAWEWIAGVFGFDPYPAAVEALGTGLADVDASGAIDPAVSTELSTALGDVTALFSGGAQPMESTDLIADLGALVSNLLS